jgi:hypothetical protein
MEEPLDETPLVLLAGIASELIPDAGIAESRAIGSTDPLLWRSYVRAVLALVEGLNYARAHVAKHSSHLTPEARLRARDAGKREEASAKAEEPSKIARCTRASFAAHAAAHQVPNPLTPFGPDWDAFREAVRIRNRITHPKCVADCRVSATDRELVRNVHHWYQELDMKLMDASRQ